MIDPVTRDIVQNIYVATVVDDNGTLRHKTLRTITAVKDKCKELKIGRCGKVADSASLLFRLNPKGGLTC